MQKNISKHVCQICFETQKYVARHLKNKHPEYTLKQYYDYFLKKKNEGVCQKCGNITKFSGYITEGYKKFCSKICCCQNNMKKRIGQPRSFETKRLISEKRLNYFKTQTGVEFKKHLSESRKGKNNPVHRQTPETKASSVKKRSETMKLKIKNGEFTPCVTNSWCFSRVIVNNTPLRSCWEAAFYILNPTLTYEKVRIPYKTLKGTIKNYIVDFVNEETSTLYEVKPNSIKNNTNNLQKQKAALKWCKKHGYNYVYISDDYFRVNAKKIDYTKYDPKIKKSMKQFLK